MLLILAGAIQLVPDGTLLFHLALIIAMVAILNATLLKPINRILEERDRRTSGRATEAESTLKQVEARLRELEHRMREARAEGYALMERERTQLSKERELKLADVRSEVNRKLANEKERLASESAEVRQTLQQEAGNIAAEISKQILGRPAGNRPVG